MKHCLERIARVQNITSEQVKEIESDIGFISRKFQVKSMSKESYHKVCLGDKHALPTCTGKDWKKFLMPCKHFLAKFEHAQGVSWNSLSEIYTSSPFFTTDVYVFGIREPVALDIENTEDPLLGSSSLHNETSNENFEKNKMERNVSKFEELTVKKEKVKIDFSCREIMKEIKSLPYIIDNRDALENLKQRLAEARDEFSHYAPTDHGLVVENSKEKVKLEKSLKRKPMENLPMPKIRKSKFTGRVGVVNEAKRFASDIYVSENVDQMLLISRQVRFPYANNIIQYRRFIGNKLHTTSMLITQ